MADNFCVYMHTAPNRKRYIGITSKAPERRWQNGTGYANNKYFTNAVKKYGWDAFSHEVLFDHLTEEAAKRLEQILIFMFKSAETKYGYNQTMGGESANGWKHTEDELQKMSESHKGEKNAFYGKTHTPEAIEKMREAAKGNKIWLGRCHSEETKAKISAAHAGKPSPTKGISLSAEHRKNVSKGRKEFLKRQDAVEILRAANPNKKPVYQFSLDGVLVKIWDSRHHAENEFVFGKKSLTIGQCCRGKCKTGYGYIWTYNPIESEVKVYG